MKKKCPFLREDWTCDFSHTTNRKVKGQEGIIPFICAAHEGYDTCEHYIKNS